MLAENKASRRRDARESRHAMRQVHRENKAVSHVTGAPYPAFPSGDGGLPVCSPLGGSGASEGNGLKPGCPERRRGWAEARTTNGAALRGGEGDRLKPGLQTGGLAENYGGADPEELRSRVGCSDADPSGISKGIGLKRGPLAEGVAPLPDKPCRDRAGCPERELSRIFGPDHQAGPGSCQMARPSDSAWDNVARSPTR